MASVEITITVEFDVEVEREYDDDGCGSPARTGNSMTGCRGSYWSIKSVTFAGTPEQAVKIINEALADHADDLNPDDYADDDREFEYDDDEY